jgi:hypothetical protein
LRNFLKAQHPNFQKSIAALAALYAVALLFAGCEFDNSPDVVMTISPSAVSLDASKTNIVALTIEGGNYNYTWSMNNSSLGTIYVATTNSASALYYNSTNIGTNLITARDSGNHSANAWITQK